MAKRIVQSVTFTLATVNYDAQVTSFGLEFNADDIETTNMDSGGWRERIGGLKGGTLTVTFAKDADDSGLQAALWTNLGVVVAFTGKGVDAAIATTNVEYQGFVLITNCSPLQGAVGDLHGASYSWPLSGAVTRDTTP